MLSGNGVVSSEITDSDLMVAWGGLISDWQAKLKALATAPNPSNPCQFDAAIQRDLPRTFPAHDFFKDRKGQEILFQLNRVYALYDEEVGYSQGISFIAAALLLHVKQAFCVLVKIMSNYGVRLLFTRNSDGLFRSLYQYERLV
ncbi:unnamed protein product, partial [Dibothriocephalus latus]